MRPRAHNLPRTVTGFVGRQRELAEIKRRLTNSATGVETGLGSARLLTLTGPGGCGKTRLAAEAACDAVQYFADGVWWIELSSLSDPALVPQVVATAVATAVVTALDLAGRSAGSPIDVLLAHLAFRHTLLVLDNCEHLLAGCAGLAEALLPACHDLRILITSQAALSIAGEEVLPVPPLAMPDLQLAAGTADDRLRRLARNESVRLFVERAAAVSPGFTLSEDNAEAVAHVCRRLDGMPLAIELAAARSKLLSPQQIDGRLDHDLRLLSGGSSPWPRHQRMQATVDWSYGLLGTPESSLLRRLSAFAGAFTLEAAEAVCAGNGLEEGEILDRLSELTDKSFVLMAEQKSGEAHYRLLEIIRQYGHEKLVEAGELDWIHENHLRYFLRLAERAESGLRSADQSCWLEQLASVSADLRDALAWSLRTDVADPEPGVRLAGALGEFWYASGHFAEGLAWLEHAAATGNDVAPQARAKVLSGAGTLAWAQGEYQRATTLHEESLALYTDLHDQRGVAFSLNALGAQVGYTGRYQEARVLFEEALALHQEVQDDWGAALALGNLGHIHLNQGDLAAARAVYEESLALWRELGDTRYVAMSLYNLGELARIRQEYSLAVALLQESIAICGERGYRDNVAVCLIALGRVACDQRDYGRAAGLHKQALALCRELGDRRALAEGLESLAWVAAARKQGPQAARLFGAAGTLRRALGAVLQREDLARHEEETAALCSRLSDEVFSAEWALGSAMTPEAVYTFAISLALAIATPPPAPVPALGPMGKGKHGPLTAREREVAALVAQGKSNRVLAQMLFVEVKTVEAHISSILSKLGFTSRAQIAAWAVAKGLAAAPIDLDTLALGE